MTIIDKLKENPDNPRTISKEKFEKLKNNIAKFPKMLELRPIVYNKKNIVLGGNMRLKAIRELLTENKIKLKDSYFKKAESLKPGRNWLTCRMPVVLLNPRLLKVWRIARILFLLLLRSDRPSMRECGNFIRLFMRRM